jgi:hypothetical protein
MTWIWWSGSAGPPGRGAVTRVEVSSSGTGREQPSCGFDLGLK